MTDDYKNKKERHDSGEEMVDVELMFCHSSACDLLLNVVKIYRKIANIDEMIVYKSESEDTKLERMRDFVKQKELLFDKLDEYDNTVDYAYY